jgi:hypothetical protein
MMTCRSIFQKFLNNPSYKLSQEEFRFMSKMFNKLPSTKEMAMVQNMSFEFLRKYHE